MWACLKMEYQILWQNPYVLDTNWCAKSRVIRVATLRSKFSRMCDQGKQLLLLISPIWRTPSPIVVDCLVNAPELGYCFEQGVAWWVEFMAFDVWGSQRWQKAIGWVRIKVEQCCTPNNAPCQIVPFFRDYLQTLLITCCYYWILWKYQCHPWRS